jgi:Thiamine pyrophosphate enzyme, C-terminal TPP binding domain
MNASIFLMAPSELVTAAQEGLAITVVILENRGYQVIHRLQVGRSGREFGNEFRTATSVTTSACPATSRHPSTWSPWPRSGRPPGTARPAACWSATGRPRPRNGPKPGPSWPSAPTPACSPRPWPPSSSGSSCGCSAGSSRGMLGRGRCTRSAAPPPPVPPAGPGPVTATRPSPPAAGRHPRWGAAGPARTAPGIGRGPTPGTHPNARRSPRGRRPPPPTPAADPQQLRQLNAAWLSMRVRLPRNAIDSSRARTLTRIGVAWLPRADQREVTTCRRAAEGSAVGDGQRDDRAPAEVVAAGLAGGVRSTVPVRPAATVTRSPPEQFGPVGQRLAALAVAGLNGQVARTGSCRVAAGQEPDGRTVMGRTARAAPS